MKRNIVRLTESQLHQVIKESVRKLIKEYYNERGSSEAKKTFNVNDETYDEIASQFGEDNMENIWDDLTAQGLKDEYTCTFASDYTSYGGGWDSEREFERGESELVDDDGFENDINNIQNGNLKKIIWNAFEEWCGSVDNSIDWDDRDYFNDPMDAYHDKYDI